MVDGGRFGVVGRDDVLDEIRRRGGDAGQPGSGSAVVVHGPPGIGVSTVLHGAAAGAAAAGAAVRMPLVAHDAPSLWAVLGAPAPAPGAPSPSVVPGDEAADLEDVAAGTVFVVDDVDALTASARTAIAEVARWSIAAGHVVVLGAHDRAEHAGSFDRAAQGSCRVLRLAPLDARSLGEVVERGARPIAAPDRAELAALAEGNPGAAIALARGRAEGPLRPLAVANDLDEAAARSLLTRILDRALGEGDLALAVEAALAMPPHEVNVLADYRPHPTRVRALERVAAALDQEDDHPDSARLLAELAAATYWGTDGGDRRAELSERRALADDALARARRSGDPDAIATCLHRRLMATWNQDTLVGDAAAIDELWERSAHSTDSVRIDAHLWRALRYLDGGDLDGFRRVVDRVGLLAEETADPLWRWTVTKWSATVAFLDGDLGRAEALATAGLGFADDLGDLTIGPWVSMISSVRFVQGREEESASLVEQVAQRTGLPGYRATWGFHLALAGATDRARSLLDSIAAASVPHDMTWLTTQYALAQAAAATGMADLAAEQHERLAPYADRQVILGSGNGVLGPVALALVGTALATGDAAGAVEQARRAVVHSGTTPWRAVALLAGSIALDRDGAATDARRWRASGEEWAAQLDADGLPDLVARWFAPGSDRRGPMAASTATGRPSAALRARDGYWEIDRAGRRSTCRSLRGIEYLALLVEHGGQPVHVLELTAAATGHPLVHSADGAGGPRLDATAIAAYRTRLADLERDIDEADAAHDLHRADRARVEHDQVTDELVRSLGLGGRSRPLGSSDAERARSSVTKAIRTAIARIGTLDPRVGTHLEATIRTGRACTYRPELDPSLEVRIER